LRHSPLLGKTLLAKHFRQMVLLTILFLTSPHLSYSQGNPVVASSEVNSCIGQITISVTSGQSPYTYQWLNSSGNDIGQQGRQISNLTPDTYTVIVTDANDSTTTEDYPVTDPPDLIGDITVTNVVCKNGRDGRVKILMANGNPDYEWELFDIDDNRKVRSGSEDELEINISGLRAGNYRIEIEDDDHCTGQLNFTISEPPTPVSINVLSENDPLCNGDSTGNISVQAIGGTVGAIGYTYSWSLRNSPGTEIANTPQLTNVPAGRYRVRVTDENGCSTFQEFSLEDPDELVITNSSIINANCLGSSNGSIDVTVEGGTGILSYSWDSGENTEDISNLSAGAYTLTVTDQNGCTIQETYTITEPSAIVAVETISNINCRGENSGRINLTVSGGNGGYSYSWTDGSTSQNRINLAAGSYEVTITDASGCDISATYNVTEPNDGLNNDGFIQSSPTCFGGNDGSLSINVSGGISPYTYQWSNNETTQAIFNLMSGDYQVIVTDANGCTISANVTLADPLAISANPTETLPSCPGNTDGSITIAPVNGDGPYNFLWDSGETTATIENLSAGTYSVTITDSKGCQTVESIELEDPDAIDGNATVSNVSCNGESDGSIQLNTIGGTGTYTYLWTSGETTDNIINLSPGNYEVTITDTNGCTFSKSYTITEPDILELNYTKTDVLCFGEATGNVDINIRGGTTPYSFVWDNGITTEDLTNINAGNYTVDVTDANGCTISQTIQIDQPNVPITVTENIINISCNGDNTGSIALEVSGGRGPYDFNWSNGSTNRDINQLTSGDYEVTITDANGCSLVETYTISAPNSLTITPNITNNSCFGESNGAIDLNIRGGTGPYTINWANGESTEDLANLGSGTYSVTVSDANGCSINSDFTITEPTELTIVGTASGVSCFGNRDGEIQIDVSGGVAPYTYQWSNGSTNKDLTNLDGGDYILTVTDTNGCQTMETITVPAPTEQLSAIGTTSDVACSGESSGEVILNVTGGTEPYSYVWSNNSRLKDLKNVPPGDYDVTITDANNCTFSASFNLSESTPLSASVTPNEPTCFGDSNGSILLDVTGGTAPYTYVWSNGSTSKDQFNLSSVQYTVTIRDANNCTLTQSIDLAGNRGLDVSINKTDIDCKGQSSGAVSLDVFGGSGNFSYLWNNGATTRTISGLSAGVYECTITDNEGCDNTVTVVIAEPSQNLGAEIEYTNKLTCFNGNDGLASVTPSGGTAPYNYLWSTGERSQSINNLVAGNHNVIVTDANGCTYQENFTITEPDSPITITSTGKLMLDCQGDTDGTINTTISGGEGPYNILWSNGASSNNLTNLSAGDYILRVTDNRGCVHEELITINEPETLEVVSFNVNDTQCYDDRTGSIEIEVSGGTEPYAYLWSNGSTSKNLIGVGAGNYNVLITDNHGCTQEKHFQLGSAPIFELNPNLSPISCTGANDASISLNITGGSAPYSINWNNGDDNEAINGLSPGLYEVDIVDSNGCSLNQTFNIVEPLPLTVDATVENANACDNPESGSIALIVSGGTKPYEYEWSNGVTSPTLTNITAGQYVVTVTDRFECTFQKVFTITQPLPLSIELTPELIIDCETQSASVKVEATAKGGFGTYEYYWSGGSSSTSTVEIKSNGRLSLLITDERGCQRLEEIDIELPRFGKADFSFTSESLEKYDSLAINDPIFFSDNSGDNIVEWEWDFGDEFSSNERNPQHTYASPNKYSIRLTTKDEAGCITEAIRNIEILQGYKLMIPNAFRPDDDGLNDFFKPKFVGFREISFQIFNKWGELIYSTSDLLTNGWDGTINGRPAPNGNYAYTFSGITFNGVSENRTGVLGLLR